MSRRQPKWKDEHPVASAALHGAVAVVPAVLGLIPTVLMIRDNRRREREELDKVKRQYSREGKKFLRKYPEEYREPLSDKMAELESRYGYDWLEDPDAADELLAFAEALKAGD